MTKENTSTDEKRKFIRYDPDELDIAYIDFNTQTQEFNPKKVGLVINESYNGCVLLIKEIGDVQYGTMYQIKIGKSAPILSTIVWSHNIDIDIVKIGFKYEL